MIDTLKDTIRSLRLPEVDLYLFSDGSGTLISKVCGSAIVSYNSKYEHVHLHTCAYSNGTNNWAELAPYVLALQYDRENFNLNNDKRTVECVTDSELTQLCGNRKYTRKCNLALWASIDYFESVGYNLHWNHVNRNTNPINKLCDKLAGETRKSMIHLLTEQTVDGIIE